MINQLASYVLAPFNQTSYILNPENDSPIHNVDDDALATILSKLGQEQLITTRLVCWRWKVISDSIIKLEIKLKVPPQLISSLGSHDVWKTYRENCRALHDRQPFFRSCHISPLYGSATCLISKYGYLFIGTDSGCLVIYQIKDMHPINAFTIGENSKITALEATSDTLFIGLKKNDDKSEVQIWKWEKIDSHPHFQLKNIITSDEACITQIKAQAHSPYFTILSSYNPRYTAGCKGEVFSLETIDPSSNQNKLLLKDTSFIFYFNQDLLYRIQRYGEKLNLTITRFHDEIPETIFKENLPIDLNSHEFRSLEGSLSIETGSSLFILALKDENQTQLHRYRLKADGTPDLKPLSISNFKLHPSSYYCHYLKKDIFVYFHSNHLHMLIPKKGEEVTPIKLTPLESEMSVKAEDFSDQKMFVLCTQKSGTLSRSSILYFDQQPRKYTWALLKHIGTMGPSSLARYLSTMTKTACKIAIFTLAMGLGIYVLSHEILLFTLYTGCMATKFIQSLSKEDYKNSLRISHLASTILLIPFALLIPHSSINLHVQSVLRDIQNWKFRHP